MKTHLVLISSQPVPNFTPVLDDRFRPDRVIMLVSPDMQERSQALEAIYKPRGVKVERWPIQDPWDIEHIRNRVMDLLSVSEQDDILLNATGGTKPMSIAAYEVFRTFEKPVFYVHPEKDHLIWMSPLNESVDLADRIKLREFLQAYGASRVSTGQKHGVPEAIRELTLELIRNIKQYAGSISALNYYAAQSDNDAITSPPIEKSYSDQPMLWRLIDLFAEAGLLQEENRRLTFPNEEARFMVNGGWLEKHVYGVCLNIKKKTGIQDVARSVEVERKQGKGTVRNELDIAFLKDNRLYVVECKTRVFKKHRQEFEKGDDVLYKLDSLRDHLGGLQAKAMLVSYNEVPFHHQNRARELKIELCCYHDLNHLEEKLDEWLTREG